MPFLVYEKNINLNTIIQEMRQKVMPEKFETSRLIDLKHNL